MDHDPTNEEIHDLLRQPMGPVAHDVAWGWLQRYRQEALEAVRQGASRTELEARVEAARAALLRRLRETLPLLIRREGECEQAVREAHQRADGVYRERFEKEVADTLADPAFTRSVAERIAASELSTFRRELSQELADLVAYHRQRLQETVLRLNEEE